MERGHGTAGGGSGSWLTEPDRLGSRMYVLALTLLLRVRRWL